MWIAAIQMVSTNDLEVNLEQAKNLLEQAAGKGAELALLPENFAMFSGTRLKEVAEAEDKSNTIRDFLSEQANRLGMAIVAGTIPLQNRRDGTLVSANRVRAVSLFIDEQGKQIARYDKLHLFDVSVGDQQGVYSESTHIEAGDLVVVVSWRGHSFGMSVCYDLRFPELYKMLVQQGADVLLVPAAFTQITGEAHWHTLLRSRAIETQCAVVGANQGGQHNEKRHTFGHTVIYDAWGKQLGLLEKGPGVVVCEIDFAAQQQIREKMPTLNHQRLDISAKL